MTLPLSRSTLVGALALALLASLTWLMVRPFWEAIAWSIILSLVTWPVYKRLRSAMRGHDTTSALVMALLVLAAVALPIGLIVTALVREVAPAYNTAVAFIASAPPPPAWAERIPGLAEFWRENLALLHTSSGAGRQWIAPLVKPGARLLAFAGDTLVQVALSLFTLFFIYRNGDRYAQQIRAVLHNLMGDPLERLLAPTREALRSVFAGVILAAGAQGLVAGIGYAIVGIKAPSLLGVATAVLAVIPFGAVVIWGGATIGLVIAGSWLKAAILLAWGLLLVSTVDNLVRPLVISNQTRLPYLQTFFAIVGGLAVFGLVGLFLGPAILALWMVLWQESVAAGSDQMIHKTNQAS